MTRCWCLAVLLAAGCVVLAMSATPTPRTTTTVQPAAGSLNDDDDDDEDAFVPFPGQRFDNFDWQLCKALDKRDSGNVILSPIGVKLVLAMLYEGAAGETAREIQMTLQLPLERFYVRRNYSSILASLQATRPEYVLDIGTKLYTDERNKIRKTYNDVLQTYYNSMVESVDFSDTSAAANRINSWVEAVTHGKIQHLVTDAESMSSTVMLLVNAIFFKGLWRFPFNPEDTAPGRFHVSAQKSVATSFMKMSHDLYYMDAKEINAKILRLPYMGKKYSMFVILPNSPTGLTQLIRDINPFILRRHLWLMYRVPVNVTMPKFSFKYTSDLKDALQELGIREIFQNSASLPAIVKGRQGNNRLYVSEVMQKAGVTVDEQGTEAYAATDIHIGNKYGDETQYTFDATHPFMFFIEDETTGTVIFVGKVVDPTHLEGDVATPAPRPPPRPTTTSRPRPGAPTKQGRRPATTPATSGRTQGNNNNNNNDEDDDDEQEEGTNLNTRTGSVDGQQSSRNQTHAASQASVASVWKELYNDRLRD